MSANPPQPITSHRLTIRVNYHETDGQRRVHHANYLNYFERGRVEMLRAAGTRYRELEESGLMLVGDEADTFRYKKATVVKAGTNVSDITDGDTIYYDKGAGYTMMFSGKKYTVILERDVVVVV